MCVDLGTPNDGCVVCTDGMAVSSVKENRSWSARHARINSALHSSELIVAISPLAAFTTQHAAFVRVLLSQLRHHLREESQMGHEVDCALALLWSSLTPARSTSLSPVNTSTIMSIERTRERARTHLDDVLRASLQPNDFSSQCTLQHGATGMVEVVRCRMDRKLYVLKSMLKGVVRREAYRFSPVYESQLLAEGYDSGDVSWTPQLHAAFQSPRSLHLLMEYLPAGDLDSLLQAASQAETRYPGKNERGLLQESWVVRYAVDMIAALGWLHSLCFVHRDIKPSNFLLDKSGRLKLCDFATCAPYAYFDELKERRVLAYYTQRPAGTCDYIAPEILQCEEARIQQECVSPPLHTRSSFQPDSRVPGAYGPAVDWWSLGVVLYEMTFGKLPFWAPQAADVYERIVHHEQHFTIKDTDLPCSEALASLIRLLICPENRRLGRHSTSDVQRHHVFHDVPWENVTEIPPPFVPDLRNGTNEHVSVLHSPNGVASGNVGWDSLSMDTPPSFSAMFQGPLDQFPEFDSLDTDPVDVSWGMDLYIPPSISPAPPTPPTASSPVPSNPSEPPPSPLSSSACAEIDTHFCAFSYVPRSDAFEVPTPPRCTSESPPPATSTPFLSKTTSFASSTPVTPAIATFSPDGPPLSTLQRTALERAYMTRQDMHTPFRPSPSMVATASSSEGAAPNSPYPFPPPNRMQRTPRTPVVPGVANFMPDTMGSDSRHSGGSTWKRSVSERQAWSELMRAVERSARKQSVPRHAPLRYAIDEQSPSPPSSPQSPSHNRLPNALDAHISSSPDSNVSSSPPPSPPLLRSRSSYRDIRPTNDANNSVHRSGNGELRHKRSTRQLLLDAQVTSTPTRAARTMPLVPVTVTSHAKGDAPAGSSPRGRTLRTLRGSASVRDFRTEYMRLEEDNFVLPTLSAPVSASAAAAPPSTRSSMDSHRTLSEYRRAPRPLNESEDAFGRRTSLSKQRNIPRRMQSTLGLSGLYRYGRPTMASVLEQTTSSPIMSSPPRSFSGRETFARMRQEQSHIEQSVSVLEKDLDDLRTRVDKMPL